MPRKRRKSSGGSRGAYNNSHNTLYPHNVPARRIYKRRSKVKRKRRK